MLKFLVLVSALAGCGKSDKCAKVFDKLQHARESHEETRHIKIDRAEEIAKCERELKSDPDAEAEIDCVLAVPGSPTPDDLARCDEAHGGFRRSASSEEALQLTRIGKNAKRVFGETGAYPTGKAALTPATSCCKGIDNQCAVDPNAWKDPVWTALDFTIDKPHRFQYSYEGDGKTYTATAVGDPACSGKPSVYTMRGAVENGSPTMKLE